MAITAQDLSYEGQGPGASGQITDIQGVAGALGQMLIANVTFTGDGATTSATAQFIPGTSGAGTLPYTPGNVAFIRTGGNAAATIYTTTGAVTASTAIVNFSAAPANAATVQLMVLILK